MKAYRLLSLITVLAVSQMPGLAQQTPDSPRPNLVSDPGFENEGQGPWLNHNFGPEFGIEWDAKDQKHEGERSLKLWATQQSDADNLWEMTGTKIIFPVSRGDIISGGAWLKWENLKDVEVFIECKWLDASQQEIKRSSTDVLGIGTEHKTAGTGDWQYQDLGMWTVKERTAPAEASYVDIRLVLLAAGTADKATGTVWWDDIQFSIQKRE